MVGAGGFRHLYGYQTGRSQAPDGESAVPGFLDDYSFLGVALLDLYEASFEPRWLDVSLALAQDMVQLFEDSENGAFFSTLAADPSLVLRIKDDYDGAEPSGNSMAVTLLLRLARVRCSTAPVDRHGWPYSVMLMIWMLAHSTVTSCAEVELRTNALM